MAGFSFAAVKEKHKRCKKPPKQGALSGTTQALDRADDAILAIAKLVDPGAWSDKPGPCAEDAEALYRQVVALSDDIEWLTAIPTTPEGEDRLIAAERHPREPVSRSQPKIRPDALQRRQQAALAKARDIVLVTEKLHAGKRRMLIKVFRKGRPPKFFSTR